MKPKVTLVDPPQNVLEKVWILWEASKVDGDIPLDVETVKREVSREKMERLFWDVLRQHIPVAEHVHFTFMLEGISVSLREQMVRHRIGTHVGDNFGVDIIPDLASSSWWSQSMRIQDMGTFADREMYRIPESLDGKMVDAIITDGDYKHRQMNAIELFTDTMRKIQRNYNLLVKAGVPMEDARELIPLGAQHRISWDINLQALLHVLGKRGCWILQLGIWGPIIRGMVEELANKVHPMFARIVAPPCIDQDDKFKSCTYRLENVRRLPDHEGKVHDQHPPCPLWLCRDEVGQEHMDGLTGHRARHSGWYKDKLIAAEDIVPRHREMKERANEYKALWRHDPYTWDKVE